MKACAVLPFYSFGLSANSIAPSILVVIVFSLTLNLHISFGPFLGLIGQTIV